MHQFSFQNITKCVNTDLMGKMELETGQIISNIKEDFALRNY